MTADTNEPDPPLADETARESLGRPEQLGDLANGKQLLDCTTGASHHAALISVAGRLDASCSARRRARASDTFQAARSARTCMSRWVSGMWSGWSGVTRSHW